MKLSEYAPPTRDVPIPGTDESITVRGLSTTDLGGLFDRHGEAIERIFAKFEGATAADDGSVTTVLDVARTVLSDAPHVAATAIAVAAGEPEAAPNVLNLPMVVQVSLAVAVINLTIDSPQTLKKVWEGVRGSAPDTPTGRRLAG